MCQNPELLEQYKYIALGILTEKKTPGTKIIHGGGDLKYIAIRLTGRVLRGVLEGVVTALTVAIIITIFIPIGALAQVVRLSERIKIKSLQ